MSDTTREFIGMGGLIKEVGAVLALIAAAILLVLPLMHVIIASSIISRVIFIASQHGDILIGPVTSLVMGIMGVVYSVPSIILFYIARELSPDNEIVLSTESFFRVVFRIKEKDESSSEEESELASSIKSDGKMEDTYFHKEVTEIACDHCGQVFYSQRFHDLHVEKEHGEKVTSGWHRDNEFLSNHAPNLLKVDARVKKKMVLHENDRIPGKKKTADLKRKEPVIHQRRKFKLPAHIETISCSCGEEYPKTTIHKNCLKCGKKLPVDPVTE